MRFNYIRLTIQDNQEEAKLNKYMTVSDLIKISLLLAIVCVTGLFLPDEVWHLLLVLIVVPSTLLIFFKNTFLKKRQLENYARDKVGIAKKTLTSQVQEGL